MVLPPPPPYSGASPAVSAVVTFVDTRDVDYETLLSFHILQQVTFYVFFSRIPTLFLVFVSPQVGDVELFSASQLFAYAFVPPGL